MEKRSLIVLYSYHHGNTEKIAQQMANVLDAEIKTPDNCAPDALVGYNLIGFGSGIDSGRNYPPLLAFADRLPQSTGQTVFIFSTFGAPDAIADQKFIRNNHRALRETLEKKGYVVVDEFACAGFNTNSFLRYFGGLHKGRPNSDDMKRAADFAARLRNGCD